MGAPVQRKLISFLGGVKKYCPATIVLLMKRLKGECRYIIHSRGCFGFCNKSPLVISLDEPSKGLTIQDHVKKQSLTEHFWSTSPSDMDISAFPSHRSISSISTTNQTLDTCSSSGANQAEFVNHGLLLWNQIRQQWVGNKGSEKQARREEPKLSLNATYESLLSSNKPFPEPIPLPEMVDFLVEVWEQDGLYD